MSQCRAIVNRRAELTRLTKVTGQNFNRAMGPLGFDASNGPTFFVVDRVYKWASPSTNFRSDIKSAKVVVAFWSDCQ